MGGTLCWAITYPGQLPRPALTKTKKRDILLNGLTTAGKIAAPFFSSQDSPWPDSPAQQMLSWMVLAMWISVYSATIESVECNGQWAGAGRGMPGDSMG